MKREASRSDNLWIGRIASLLAGLAVAYWFLFALLSPVTVYDAHVYHLPRLCLAWTDGFWSNPNWTSDRQVVLPWGFDAIHFPFLILGFGFGVPSFLCLLLILLVVWKEVGSPYGRTAAWLGVVVVLGMPTVVFQSAIPKNDLAVLAGIAVWYHALRKWDDSHRRRYLMWAAMAIGFTAGAKTSGLLMAAGLLIISIWIFRQSLKNVGRFLGAVTMALILFGSIETYALAHKTYGNPLGSDAFVDSHRNPDGLAGASANAIRYLLANTSTGLEPLLTNDPITPFLEDTARVFLAMAGLANTGYRSDFHDDTLIFLRDGGDVGSDFGPIGTFGLFFSLGVFVWFKWKSDWWRLSASGLLCFWIISYSVSWMPWNNRFLTVPFVMFSLVPVIISFRYRIVLLQVVLLVLAGTSIILYPLYSFNKKPNDLRLAITDRDSLRFSERPGMHEVMLSIREWVQEHEHGQVVLLAGADSWVLPILQEKRIHLQITTMHNLEQIIAQNRQKARSTLVVVLDRPDFVPVPSLQIWRCFQQEPHSSLWSVRLDAELFDKCSEPIRP